MDLIFVLTDLYWKNPQFFITIEDVDKTDNRGLATLIMTLTEKEANNKSSVAIGFDVYKVIEITGRNNASQIYVWLNLQK